MLWSVMPENVVLAGWNDEMSVVDGQVGKCVCRLRVGAGGAYAVERLISTDPVDFLSDRWQPGRQIYMK